MTRKRGRPFGPLFKFLLSECTGTIAAECEDNKKSGKGTNQDTVGSGCSELFDHSSRFPVPHHPSNAHFPLRSLRLFRSKSFSSRTYQRSRHSGFRFSMKALMPSFAS